MGSGRKKAAAVNLLVYLNPQWRDTVSKQTATTSTIQITATTPTLMLAMELGEASWKLGFSSAFGQAPLVRDIGSRDRKVLLAQIAWAKKKLDLPDGCRVVSCYEAGREGFWLHRFLVAEGIENLIVDSSSIEVPQKRRRAKTDRLDLAGLCDLLARHLAGSAKRVWSIVRVPSESEEDRRHLHRELKTSKQDRTRVSNRIKSLLANNGLTISTWKDLGDQLLKLSLWNGNPLPPSLQSRLERYARDYAYYSERIRILESERRDMLSQELRQPGTQGQAVAKAAQLYSLRGVGINTSWLYSMEFFSWRTFRNTKEVGSLAGLTPTPKDSGKRFREQGIGKDGSRHIRGSAIELAWGWLRFQPESDLSRWFERRFGSGSKRIRKIGIVALARKLLIALWRFVETGVIPEGAVLKTDLRLH
jgi:transposase